MKFGLSQFITVSWHTKLSSARDLFYLKLAATTTTVLAGIAALTAAPVWAYDPAHLTQLQIYGVCLACDLSGADLTTGSVSKIINVTGSNLKSANVSNRLDLAGASFEAADLSSADFSGSVGEGVNFKNAIADGAKFTLATFTKAQAAGSSFINAEVIDANFSEASFYKANLTGANFQGTWAIGADFTQANITNFNISYGDISDAKFQFASALGNRQYSGSFYETGVPPTPPPNLDDCKGGKIEATETIANRTDFKNFVANEILAAGFQATKADFSNASVCYAQFTDAILEGTNFSKAQFNINNSANKGLIVDGANLKTANFTEAYLFQSQFNGADLENAIFEKTNLQGAAMAGANLQGVSWRYAYLKNADLFEAKNAEEKDLSYADYLMGIRLPSGQLPQFCDQDQKLTGQTGTWSDRTIFGYSHNYSGCHLEISPEKEFDFIDLIFESLGLPGWMIEVYEKTDLTKNLFGITDWSGQKTLQVKGGAIVKFLTGFNPEKPGVKLTYNAVLTPTPPDNDDPKDDDGSKDDGDPKDDDGSKNDGDPKDDDGSKNDGDPKDDDGSKDDGDPKDDGGSNGDDDTGDPPKNSTKVPEPGIGLGLAGLALAGWLRRKQGDRPTP